MTNKKCQKCGHVRSDADLNAPDYACPKCGAVYAKVEAALRSKAELATVPTRQGARTTGKVPPEYPGADAQANAEFACVIEDRMSNGTKIAHIIYALYLLGFAFPLIWVACVITAHVMRSPNTEGWLNEHFTWQIRTFWFSLMWGVLTGVLVAGLEAMLRAFFGTVIGLVVIVYGGWVLGGLFAILGVWILYRIIRGWVSLFRAVAP